MSPEADPRETGVLAEHRNATPRAERIAAGWQPRFVVDQTRVVEMVRLYQSLGYETAVDPIGPENLPPPAAGVPVHPDRRCGECRLVALRWLHVIYTRAVNTARGQ